MITIVLKWIATDAEAVVRKWKAEADSIRASTIQDSYTVTEIPPS